MRKVAAIIAGAVLALTPGALAAPQDAGAPRPALEVTPVPTPPTVKEWPAEVDRLVRARENITALRDGRRSVSDLTPIELQDVLDLDRRLGGDGPDTRTPQQQCIDDEVRRAGGRPTQLAWQVIELKCR